MDHIEAMSQTLILQTSDLKRNAGKILDAARTKPQFIVRDGILFQIIVTEIPAGNPPPNFFADAYPLSAERHTLEAAASRVLQFPERQ
jgi:hypothetical protein